MQKEMKDEREGTPVLPVKTLSQRARREYVMKALFLADFYEGNEQDGQAALFLSMEGLSDELSEALLARYRWAASHRGNVDSILAEASQGWDLHRIGRAELAILRLAAAEICHDPEIPAAVAVNEAVELAKRYGGEQAGSFVNGILGKVVRQYGSESV
ncbi:MAG: transcription antitermination factor NusB [Lachnospiraceae bacterium]|nr:transcription antitermination factor NusB [Lachnospiraceae bacterium]